MADDVDPALLDSYADRFARLSVATKHGLPAPHKPLMLLAVIDLAERGLLDSPRVEPSPELLGSFRRHWERLAPAGFDINPALPFFHLRADGFWRHRVRPGMEGAYLAARSARTLGELGALVEGAELDAGLFAVLSSPAGRARLREALVAAYLSGGRRRADPLARSAREEAAAMGELLEAASRPFVLDWRAACPLAGPRLRRSAAFRSLVLHQYGHACSVCGLGLSTAEGDTAVDAAHVAPFRRFANDDPRNGLGLCKLHHWLFDRGLLAVGGEGTVLVSPLLLAPEPAGSALAALEGAALRPPRDGRLAPAPEALAWHLGSRFRAG